MPPKKKKAPHVTVVTDSVTVRTNCAPAALFMKSGLIEFDSRTVAAPYFTITDFPKCTSFLSKRQKSQSVLNTDPNTA